jgi:hypothetical protein
MNKSTTLAVATAFTLSLLLTACGEDTDCDSAGQLGDVTTMSLVDGRSGGTSGGGRGGSTGSRSGGSKTGKTGTSGSSSTGGKSGKVKVDDDWFDGCDD